MDYLIQYGLFLAKVATLVIALVLLLSAITSMGGRQRRGLKRGSIVVENLNDHLDDLRDSLRCEVLDSAEFKLEQKRKLKEEKKSAKQAKAEAKKKLKSVPAKAGGESVSTDKDRRRRRVYVLDFDGDVAAQGVESLREEITAVLSLAQGEDEIVLKLQSPGGMVHAYGLAASQLQRIKDAKIHLTICVDNVAASGGYMMACLADRIVAAPFAIIGSIGVVVQLPNFHRVLKKNDVDFEVISAGEYKRTLSTFGEITEKGRSKVQEDVETIHELFKNWVKTHRPSVEIDKVATGETWVGSQAKERYLVDELNTSDAVILRACEAADVYEVSYRIKQSLQEKLGATVERGVMRAVQALASSDHSKDFQ